MTIQNLIDNFTIQGAFCIKEWDWEEEDYIILASGNDFECDYFDIADSILESGISYMYAIDGVMTIEVE